MCTLQLQICHVVLHVGCSFGVKIEADITPTWGREVSSTLQIVVFVVLVVVAIVVYGVGCAVCGVRRPLWRSDFDHFQTSKQAETDANE